MARRVGWQDPVQHGGQNRRLDGALVVGGSLTVAGAIDRFIYSRQRAVTTQRNLRDNLLGGRFTSWREDHVVIDVEDLTAELAVQYLISYRQGRGAAVATVDKVRRQLLELGAWLRDQHGVDVLARPPLVGFRVPALRPDSPGEREEEAEKEAALTAAEAQHLIGAAKPGRDRVAVQMLLYTGLRGSELIGLCRSEVLLDARPPRLIVRRTAHHRSRVKTAAGFREVPLDMGGRGLPAVLRRYLESKPEAGGRPTDTDREELFLAHRVRPDAQRGPWSMTGLKQMLAKLGKRTGIHANPHRFRHTCATNLVHAGMHDQHLMAVMGWKDIAMVSLYFRGRASQATLEAADRIRY